MQDSKLQSVFKIKGKLQNYKWGGHSFIPELLGDNPSEQPVAEYWLGAHPNATSIIEETGKSLVELINDRPEQVLGEKVYEQFGRLPYLFKVLDVKDMLSIQVHPSKSEAEKGFAREDELGIPRDAAHRNYKDDNHKPEIMVALSDFWLLHGFKSSDKILNTLKNTKELNHLVEVFEKEGLKALYSQIMQENDEQTSKILQPLIDRLKPDYDEGNFQKSQPEYWAVKAYETFCVGTSAPFDSAQGPPLNDQLKLDKGIYSIFLFNIVQVKKGEAIFQDAGIPHAYLEGQNMELMANSDNVLRAGLTPKYVDVPELLQQVKFEETEPNILSGDAAGTGEEVVYKSPAPDFQLSKIELKAGQELNLSSHTLDILIVLNGLVQIGDGSDAYFTVAEGEAFAITASRSVEVKAQEQTVLYRASCPR